MSSWQKSSTCRNATLPLSCCKRMVFSRRPSSGCATFSRSRERRNVKIRSKKYLVQSLSFAEMLEATIHKYQNRTIEAAQVIAELIELAKQMREGQKRGESLGLTDDEVAFYDALKANDSAVKVLGEPTLKNIARELVSHVRKSVTIDWTLRESAQAQIRVLVRRILRKYGYPPDKQEKATQTVLEQAKLLCGDGAEQI